MVSQSGNSASDHRATIDGSVADFTLRLQAPDSSYYDTSEEIDYGDIGLEADSDPPTSTEQPRHFPATHLPESLRDFPVRAYEQGKNRSLNISPFSVRVRIDHPISKYWQQNE